MELTDEDITEVENFVREKTLAFVEKKLKTELNCNEVLLKEEHLVDYFGDLYASDPVNFRFEIGDKKTIKYVRDHIKSQVNKKGSKYLRRFREKKIQRIN